MKLACTCRFLNCVVLDEILLNGSETFERILKQKQEKFNSFLNKPKDKTPESVMH